MDDEQSVWRRIPPHVTAERMIHIPRFYNQPLSDWRPSCQMAARRDSLLKAGIIKHVKHYAAPRGRQ